MNLRRWVILVMAAVLLLSGCTHPTPRQPPSPTFTPVWLSARPPEQSTGFTVNGLSVGGTLTGLETSLAKDAVIEKVDWRYEVRDPHTHAKVFVTVDEAGKIVTLWSNSEGSLEKDGRPLVRTHDPQDKALQVLGLPLDGKSPWMAHEGSATASVDGGPAVYSVSLWDEAFRKSTLNRP